MAHFRWLKMAILDSVLVSDIRESGWDLAHDEARLGDQFTQAGIDKTS
jgi:hypothetical protein